MNPQSRPGAGEHALPKTKTEIVRTYPRSSDLCSVPPLNKPARCLRSLAPRGPPHTAPGRGQLNPHCSPHRVRSLVGHQNLWVI
ncbi:hypothetical protein PBY51_011148 [Eleginops maclovinus]|uniref:Uncharacterized protein n=1 Tax=Eleginops maclovinus TaxID=56733 RepID=A0AAN8AJ20_ELEMC|nr:hypothetical protein PBY51_011148 [Eleginops maclovinus]